MDAHDSEYGTLTSGNMDAHEREYGGLGACISRLRVIAWDSELEPKY